MQRVIALDGVPETRAKTAKTDLSQTVHEWAALEHEPSSGTPEPPLQRRDPQWATHSSISLQLCDDTQLSARILNASIDDAVTQQFNPAPSANAPTLATSTADLASLDRALESAGVLEAHELDDITTFRQASTPGPIQPEAPSSTQAAPAQPPPRMLLIPASIVWTVMTAFSLCVLALILLSIAFVFRGQLSFL